MIVIKENINNIQEFNYLYDAVGWDVNTLYSVSIYNDGKIIGY